ncbi:hypothetical protein LY76DRAFT_595662 [Colletotrichum caudatum]|nr:hypothetical protein LY76DRAFT_595662 [Colletotrichum caudatum]
MTCATASSVAMSCHRLTFILSSIALAKLSIPALSNALSVLSPKKRNITALVSTGFTDSSFIYCQWSPYVVSSRHDYVQ